MIHSPRPLVLAVTVSCLVLLAGAACSRQATRHPLEHQPIRSRTTAWQQGRAIQQQLDRLFSTTAALLLGGLALAALRYRIQVARARQERALQQQTAPATSKCCTLQGGNAGLRIRQSTFSRMPGQPGTSLTPAPRPTLASGLELLLLADQAAPQQSLHAYFTDATHGPGVVQHRAVVVEQLQTDHYDVVVLHIPIPVMDASPVTRCTRSWEQGQGQATRLIVTVAAQGFGAAGTPGPAPGDQALYPTPTRQAVLLNTLLDCTPPLDAAAYPAQPASRLSLVS
ncbi:MAG: hypothetical protein AB7N91_14855 [Candidatus Tectimicrobiota bacterium]